MPRRGVIFGVVKKPDEAADLKLVEGLFAQHGLKLEPFKKTEIRAGKTPDRRILRGDQQIGFVEVKSPRDDWLDEQLEKATPGQIVGGLRDDPIFNRLARQIQKAAQQFDAVNPDIRRTDAIDRRPAHSLLQFCSSPCSPRLHAHSLFDNHQNELALRMRERFSSRRDLTRLGSYSNGEAK